MHNFNAPLASFQIIISELGLVEVLSDLKLRVLLHKPPARVGRHNLPNLLRDTPRRTILECKIGALCSCPSGGFCALVARCEAYGALFSSVEICAFAVIIWLVALNGIHRHQQPSPPLPTRMSADGGLGLWATLRNDCFMMRDASGRRLLHTHPS